MAGMPTFPSSNYISPEESINKDVISSVEMTMKRYTDNIVRFLEGISSRLSQLELYCYNLDKSVGEMRSDLGRDHEDADTKLKSLEKHLQEVHRSVQILRDKQELADTQKELANLQRVQKEPSFSLSHSQQGEDTPKPQTSDTENTDNSPDPRAQQLALVLPQQVAPQVQQQSIPPPPLPVLAPIVPQSYYIQPSQMQNPPQGQYLPPDSHYQTQQAPPQLPAQPQTNQLPQLHPLPHYQQQWSQQSAPQPPSMQPQIRPPDSSAYASYLPNQHANPSPSETINNMPMQACYSGISQPGGNRVDATPYNYGAPPAPIQQPQPQQVESQYGNDGYTTSSPYPSLSSGNSYMMYQNDGGRTHKPHYPEGTYPPPSVPHQGPSSNTATVMSRPPQFSRGHPYNELIDKLGGMGYRGDHVASVIQRLEENGQSVDFNTVLDILNGHPSGGSQRGWSG